MSEYEGRLKDYVDVPSRIRDFRAKFPDGSLQPVDPTNPYDIITIRDAVFIVYKAAAYRTPDDPRPGIGVAYEPVPGKTPYTRDSELQNAETSAWGRAIIAALASDSKTIASREEIQNRQPEERQEVGAYQSVPVPAERKQNPGPRLRMIDALFTKNGIMLMEERRGWVNTFLDREIKNIADDCSIEELDKVLAKLQGKDSE